LPLFCRQLQVSGESSGWRLEEKISDLEQRLRHRDMAATSDIESLRAELQATRTQIDQLRTADDNSSQYALDVDRY